jgi:hypothetical protein
MLSLTRAELLLSRRLITRQLRLAPNVPRELRKYGAEGSVRLCSARALGPYILGLAAVAIGFGVAGVAAVALPAVVLMWTLGVLAILRANSAARSGRRWRARRSGEDVMR